MLERSGTVSAQPEAIEPAGQSECYRLGHLVITRYRSFQLAVVLLMAINVFNGLHNAVVSDMDEARYGVAASEMLDTHDWLVPTYAGQPEYWNLKPPLGYWLIQASYSLLGRSSLALRLPSALCAVGVVSLTMVFSRRWFGRQAAVLAGLFMATCYGFISHHGARSGDLDAPLTLISLLLLLQLPRVHTSSFSRVLFGLLLAIGFLLKSFAILPFAFAAAIYLLWINDQPFRWREWLPALAVFIGIVGSWVLMRIIRDGSPYFVIRMTNEDLLMRATQEVDKGSGYVPWRYLVSMFDRFAPWPVFIVAGLLLQLVITKRPLKLKRLVLVWAFLPLVLFSSAHTHHHWYLDPAYPAFALLAALSALALIKRESTTLSRTLVMSMVVVLVIGCEVRVMTRSTFRDRMPHTQIFLTSLAKYNHGHHTPLNVYFPLTHSERFILQVVCDFDVQEHEPVSMSANVSSAAAGLSLHRVFGDAMQIRNANPQFVLAQYENLLLVNRDGNTDDRPQLANDDASTTHATHPFKHRVQVSLQPH